MQKVECEYHNENVFLKSERALSKLSFFFHSKSIKGLVIFRKFNSHLQYYEIDLSFSIKL